MSRNQAPVDAPAVVLVHGLGMSSRDMMPTADRLADRYRVYVPDLPGFGLSDTPPRILDIAETAAFLGVWIETLGLDRPALVANSVGCQVAIDLAMHRPSLVDRIVLQGPTMARGRRSWAWQLLRQQQNDRQEPSFLQKLHGSSASIRATSPETSPP
jgi:pimeloyl-ACP methyl ester carboxylesterase